MKYVALLRGINVGGNNSIKMVDLKKAFEDHGFEKITTFIQSGNVIFESDKKSIDDIREELEKLLSKKFSYSSRIVVRSHQQLKEIVRHIPQSWIENADVRCYVAFVREPLTTQDVAKEIHLNNDVDTIDVGSHILYMTTKMSGLSKSGFTKLIGTKIYKD